LNTITNWLRLSWLSMGFALHYGVMQSAHVLIL